MCALTLKFISSRSLPLSVTHTHTAEQKLPHSPGSAFTTTSEQRNLLKVQFKLVCASEMASSRQGEGGNTDVREREQ